MRRCSTEDATATLTATNYEVEIELTLFPELNRSHASPNIMRKVGHSSSNDHSISLFSLTQYSLVIKKLAKHSEKYPMNLNCDLCDDVITLESVYNDHSRD